MKIVELYYRGLSLTLLALVISRVRNGTWLVHSGDLYNPALQLAPLMSTTWLALDWIAITASAVALWLGVRRRAALCVAIAAILLDLSQRFHHDTSLWVVILTFTALRPPKTDADLTTPNMILVRWQVSIVYAVAGLTKILSGFWRGLVLERTFYVLHDSLLPHAWLEPLFRRPVVALLAIVTILIELAIPVALAFRPRLGLALIVILHMGITILMPSIFPFGMLMFSLALVYLVPAARAPAIAPAAPA